MTGKRGPSGTQPKLKGRSLKALSKTSSAKAIIYYLAWRHKSWDSFHRPPPPEDEFVWEFYYSKPTFERAKETVLAGKHPKVYAGQFPLAALLHPKIAEDLTQGGV